MIISRDSDDDSDIYASWKSLKIPIVSSIDFILEHMLPQQVDVTEMDVIKSTCRRDILSYGRIPSDPSTTAELAEEKAFDALSDVFATIKKRIPREDTTILNSGLQSGSKLPYGEQALASFEVFTFHNNDSGINRNVRTLIDSVSSLFHEDPRRLFTFGLTIEATYTRIWFFSRSHVVVSEPFDLAINIDPLVHYLVSISLSTHEAAGLDPTVRRISEVGLEDVYEYLVDGIWYKTVSCLSDSSTKSIVGSNSRIWHVQNADGVDYVLKDYWPCSDALTEDQIQHSILDRVNKVNPVKASDMDPTRFMDHFMPIHVCKIMGCTTQSFMRHSLPGDLKWFPVFRPIHLPDFAVGAPKSLHWFVPPSSIAPTRNPFKDRKQCRILFPGIGTALGDIDDLPLTFKSLAHVAKGLMYLFSAGVVHRDLSLGNIILLDGYARISDLEYSLPLDEKEARNFRKSVGTLEFMITELREDTHLFRKFVIDERIAFTLENLKIISKLALASAQVPDTSGSLQFWCLSYRCCWE